MSLSDLGIVDGECRLVVEAGACNGDLSYALDAVDAAAATGVVWGFKAQFYRREQLVTRSAPTYGHELVREPALQWDHFANQLTWTEWQTVQDRCTDRGLVFFASVFDTEAVNVAMNLDMPLYKIASADITHKPLLEAIAATGKPIVLSTGGATVSEIALAYTWIRAVNPTAEILPLICTLSYPTPPGEARMSRITWWRENMQQIPIVGWSDHTEGISAMLTARDLGAAMIEKHFTITPGAGGDHDFAITPQALEVYKACPPGVPGPNYAQELGDPELGPRAVERAAIDNARRSLAAARDLPAGTIIQEGHVAFLRPGTGAYAPWQLEDVVGLATPVDIPAGSLLPVLRQQRPGSASGRATITANLTVE